MEMVLFLLIFLPVLSTISPLANSELQGGWEERRGDKLTGEDEFNVTCCTVPILSLEKLESLENHE